MRDWRLLLPATLIALAAAARLAIAQPAPDERVYSAAYWRDVCAGRQVGVSRAEQGRTCRLYLSSFYDAADEFGEAGHKLFCPPDPISAETMRRDFLAYMADIPETAEFFPVGRALLQALMRTYPCRTGR
jgi:hypothetical protein